MKFLGYYINVNRAPKGPQVDVLGELSTMCQRLDSLESTLDEYRKQLNRIERKVYRSDNGDNEPSPAEQPGPQLPIRLVAGQPTHQLFMGR